MGISWRQSAIFAAGAAAGAVLAGWLVLNADSLKSEWESTWEKLSETEPAPQQQAQAIRQEAPCPGKPSISPASAEDGQFKLVERVANQRASDVGALVVIGKEAAAGGRPRDAEVAFIIACRVGTQLRSDVHIADAKYQLASHYANIAKSGPASVRDDLSSRARVLYSDASRVYDARLGKQHEKTRFAALGLAALQPGAPQDAVVTAAAPAAQEAQAATAPGPGRAAAPVPAASPQRVSPAPVPGTQQPAAAPQAPVAAAAAPAPAPAPARAATPPAQTAPVVAAAPAPPPAPARAAESRSNDTRVAGAGPAARVPPPPAKPPVAQPRRETRETRAARAPAAAPRLNPSFDCANARSRTERLICSDSQLAQLDRELGRLHARARTTAADPADFKRRSDAEWSRRESTCADRSCLLAWYAQRRVQLLDELDSQRARGGSLAGG